jgi:hypothetical protein
VKTFGFLIGGALVFVLSGCSLLFPDAPAEPGAGATFPPALPTAFAIGCNDVLSLDELHPVWGEAMKPAPYAEAGAAGSWQMQGTALVQDGALACAWAKPGSEGDPQLVVLALDAAGDGYRRFEPSFLSGEFAYESQDSGDASQAFCRSDSGADGGQCHWNVLAGDTWVSFFFQGLAKPEPTVEQAALVDAAIARIEASPRLPVTRALTSLPPCEHVTIEQVAAAAGLEASSLKLFLVRGDDEVLGTSTPKFGQVMWAYSYERLGYSECGYPSGDAGVDTMVAPGAAWILNARFAQQPPLTQVGDLGRGVETCFTDSGSTICTVAVVSGDDLVLVQLEAADEETGEHDGEELAHLLIAG